MEIYELTKQQRDKHYRMFSSPLPGTDNYKNIIKLFKSKSNKQENDKKYSKMRGIFNAQALNGVDLHTPNELRYFHQEYNERLWKYGLGAMPGSFNILEAFFKFNPQLLLFELFEEVQYLFSIFDYVDFITTNNLEIMYDRLSDIIEDNTIYNFDIIDDFREITFNTSRNQPFGITGVSIIKRNEELVVLVIGAEKDDNTIPEFHDESSVKVKPFLEPSEELEFGKVKYDEDKSFCKVFLSFTFDLVRKKIINNYVLHDLGNSFNLLTDDDDVILGSISDVNLAIQFVKTSRERLADYKSIFEIAYKLIYLFIYINDNKSYITYADYPTKLVNEKLGDTVINKIRYSRTHYRRFKNVYVIDKQTRIVDCLNDDRTFPDNIRYDKYDKKGYIYILRNSAHPVNMFKIGLTTRTVEIRAKELSGTSSPDRFLIAHQELACDCYLAESIIHKKLEAYRSNKRREFFEIDFEVAIKTVSSIVRQINDDYAKRYE